MGTIEWQARRHAKHHGRGDDVRLGVLARGQRPPFPPKWRLGFVHSQDRPLIVRYLRRRKPTPLVGLTVVREERMTRDNDPNLFAVLRMITHDGALAEIAVVNEFSDTLWDAMIEADAFPSIDYVPLGRRELVPTYEQVTRAVAARADAERWYDRMPDERLPASGVRWRTVVGPRIGYTVIAFFLFLIVFGFNWTSVATSLWFHEERAQVMTMTVREIDKTPLLPVVPLNVELDIPQSDHTVTVTSTRRASVGDRLPIAFDPADPTRARLAGPGDAVGRGVSTVLGAFALLCAYGVWQIGIGVRELRRARRARSTTGGAAVPYAITRDVLQIYQTLLFRPGSPVLAVPIGRHLPEEVPPSGYAAVFGSGDRPVLHIGGREIYPTAPSVPVRDEDLTGVVDGDVPVARQQDDRGPAPT